MSDTDVEGTRKRILSIVDNFDEDERGLTAGNLKQKMDLDKSTVSYHTGKLEEKLLLTSVKVGRKKFYSVSPKGKEALENDGITEEIVAECGNCGQSHTSFEDAKECCMEEVKGLNG